VAYEEGVKPQLERKLFLEDAISDLPAVGYISRSFNLISCKLITFSCLIHFNVIRLRTMKSVMRCHMVNLLKQNFNEWLDWRKWVSGFLVFLLGMCSDRYVMYQYNVRDIVNSFCRFRIKWFIVWSSSSWTKWRWLSTSLSNPEEKGIL
jgi:hypothetical protein